jgi:hypothetical protein
MPCRKNETSYKVVEAKRSGISYHLPTTHYILVAFSFDLGGACPRSVTEWECHAPPGAGSAFSFELHRPGAKRSGITFELLAMSYQLRSPRSKAEWDQLFKTVHN